METFKLSEEELKMFRDVSIHALLGIKNNGRTIMIHCPFHNSDRTPSCAINANNTFKCFGCGTKGGGAIDFLIKNGFSFKESLDELSSYV